MAHGLSTQATAATSRSIRPDTGSSALNGRRTILESVCPPRQQNTRQRSSLFSSLQMVKVNPWSTRLNRVPRIQSEDGIHQSLGYCSGLTLEAATSSLSTKQILKS